MVNWNPSTLIILTMMSMTLSYIPQSNATSNPTSYLRYYNHSELLFKRKIADSNSHPKVLNDIHDLAGCPGEICGTLAGDAVQPLLAGASECAQQDMADKMIDIAKTQLQDENVRKKLIELAKIYRQTERNTFPDYSSPNTPDTNSLFCKKEPKNSELSGLIQAQSKTADPNLFFDPKVNGKSVRKGSDPRTIPLGQSSEEKKSSLSSNSSSTTGEADDNNGQEGETTKTNPETGDVETDNDRRETDATKSNNSTDNDTSSSKNSSDSGLLNQHSVDQDSSNIQTNSDSNLRKTKHKIGRCRPKNKA